VQSRPATPRSSRQAATGTTAHAGAARQRRRLATTRHASSCTVSVHVTWRLRSERTAERAAAQVASGDCGERERPRGRALQDLQSASGIQAIHQRTQRCRRRTRPRNPHECRENKPAARRAQGTADGSSDGSSNGPLDGTSNSPYRSWPRCFSAAPSRLTRSARWMAAARSRRCARPGRLLRSGGTGRLCRLRCGRRSRRSS
jgi:hypothetical protein